MDAKNVILAILLSTIVLVGWGTYFAPPPPTPIEVAENETKSSEVTSSPSIESEETKNEITRKDAINKTNRIKVENENIKGSISLQGGIIDDIIFKNYNETLNGKDKVIFLNPRNSPKLDENLHENLHENISTPLLFHLDKLYPLWTK